MSTAADRLREARERRGFTTAKEAAEKMNVAVATYIQHENGIRGYPAVRARKYAEFFGTTPEWLLYGRETVPATPSSRSRARSALTRAPVIDSVAAGRLADPVAQIEGDVESIEISGLPPGDYFATRVQGDSMDRLSPDGSVILVNRIEREPLPGRRYVFARRGQTTYKRFERNPIRLVPESTNPAHEPIFPATEEEWTVIGRVRLTLFDDL